MAKGKLGFGWMRLPQKSENPEDIDFEQVNQMVDAYLDAGCVPQWKKRKCYPALSDQSLPQRKIQAGFKAPHFCDHKGGAGGRNFRPAAGEMRYRIF